MNRIEKRLRNLQGFIDYKFLKLPEEVIRLDRNENFLIPENIVRGIVSKALEQVDIRKYPDEDVLYDTFTEFLGVATDEIIFGSGSDDIIYKLSLAFTSRDEEAIIAVPTFTVYRWAVERVGGRVREALLNEDFTLNIDRILSLYNDRTGLIFICSPNNPTGNVFSKSLIRKILEDVECPVVVDEAYYYFSEGSLIELFNEGFENLALLRSFSKIGFAGVRLGYLLADKKIVSILRKYMMPYSINMLSIMIGVEITRNFNIIYDKIEEMVKERERVLRELRKINNIVAYETHTNFILVKLLEKNVANAIESLRKGGVAVKDVSSYPLLDGCFRVTIGNREMNNSFLNLLRDFLDEE